MTAILQRWTGCGGGWDGGGGGLWRERMVPGRTRIRSAAIVGYDLMVFDGGCVLCVLD